VVQTGRVASESTNGARALRPVASPVHASREQTLTPLGLSPAELAQALGRYRLRLHALIGALHAGAPISLDNDALPALEELGALIDVDIGARSASIGQARMSEVERRVLVPLLARLDERLAVLRPTVPARNWLPILHSADEDVAHAERALARR
jgi:hypothetical protein